MQILSEACVLLIAYILYWCNRERRKYLRKRVGSKSLLNVYHVGRNIGFMLMKKDLQIKGDTKILRKGGILYSFHFGLWELMPQSLRKAGFNLGVIVNKYGDDNNNFTARFFDKYLYRFRSSDQVRIFYKENTMSLVKHIKGGGLLGMLVDGDLFYSKFEKAQKLSRLFDVPLVPFAAYRSNGKGILEIGCDLNELVAQRPYDYVWFYKSRNKGVR